MNNNLIQLTGVDMVVPTHGLEGAKAYPMGPNCRAPLFDDQDDVFYIKSTDANGFPTVRKYRFTEEVLIDQRISCTGFHSGLRGNQSQNRGNSLFYKWVASITLLIYLTKEKSNG